jgi:hypothetical protein
MHPTTTANRVPQSGTVVTAAPSSGGGQQQQHTVDMDRRQRNARRKDIKLKLDKWDRKQDG